MFVSALRNAFAGRRKEAQTHRKHCDVVAAWLGAARLGEAPAGQLAKRRHRRWSWMKKLTLSVDGHQFSARAFDLSSAGMGLFVPARLSVGWIVQLTGDGRTWIPARVVHVASQAEGNLYRTGVEFISSGDAGTTATNA